MNVSDQRIPDYQVVLIVEYDDGRMYPLVDSSEPKCLLPVANRKLLAYQLDMIAKSGVVEVYIVAPADYQVSLSHFLSDYVIRENLTIEKIFVEKDKFDSADALRAVSERIRGDFICINSDVFSRFSLGELVTFHRIRQADLTMLLVAAPIDEPEKKGGKRKLRVEEEDQEYIAVCEDGRVVMKLPVTDAEEAVEMSKSLLARCGALSLRSDLLDMGIYVMSKWMLEHIAESRAMQNIKAEALPFFIARQFQSTSYLLDTFPSLQHRRRTLAALEPWLASTTSFQCAAEGQQFDLADCLARDLLQAARPDAFTLHRGNVSPPSSPRPFGKFGLSEHSSLSNFERVDSMQSASSDARHGQGSSPIGLVPSTSSPHTRGQRGGSSEPLAPPDLVRCYAYLYDRPVAPRGGQARQPSLTLFNTVRSGGVYPISDHQASAGGAGGASSSGGGGGSSGGGGGGGGAEAVSEPLLLQRLTNIQSYMSLNRDMPSHTHTAATPWARLTGYRKKEQSLVGEHTVIGVAAAREGAGGSAAVVADSSVTLKASTIGHGVQIGAKSKINNSIIMDNVVVGEK